VVKRSSADGSVGSPHVRVGHRQALIAYLVDSSMLLISAMLMYWHTLRVSIQNPHRIKQDNLIRA
ncbi:MULTISPECIES: hypothetical protein, partial [unclassified Salinivibrio]|uniref:hypothetical protein n=1 Tax=unclassified Salinivibrio TaxID=2636825 RepID=UPI001A7E0B79